MTLHTQNIERTQTTELLRTRQQSDYQNAETYLDFVATAHSTVVYDGCVSLTKSTSIGWRKMKVEEEYVHVYRRNNTDYGVCESDARLREKIVT